MERPIDHATAWRQAATSLSLEPAKFAKYYSYMRGKLHTIAGMDLAARSRAYANAKESYFAWELRQPVGRPALGEVKKKIRDLIWTDDVKKINEARAQEHVNFNLEVMRYLKATMQEINVNTVPVANANDDQLAAQLVDIGPGILTTSLTCPMHPYYYHLKKFKMEVGGYVGFGKVSYTDTFHSAARTVCPDGVTKPAVRTYIIQKAQFVQPEYADFNLAWGPLIKHKQITVVLGVPRAGKVNLEIHLDL